MSTDSKFLLLLEVRTLNPSVVVSIAGSMRDTDESGDGGMMVVGVAVAHATVGR